jgi:hypothetical protein
MDVVHDTLVDGRKIRILSVVDDFTRREPVSGEVPYPSRLETPTPTPTDKSLCGIPPCTARLRGSPEVVIASLASDLGVSMLDCIGDGVVQQVGGVETDAEGRRSCDTLRFRANVCSAAN